MVVNIERSVLVPPPITSVYHVKDEMNYCTQTQA